MERDEEITRLLHAAKTGREADESALMSAVYAELKSLARMQLARCRPGQTLNTTALVHESYAKLASAHDLDYIDRNHFFAVSAHAMRQIVVDYARSLYTNKRKGEKADIDLTSLPDDGHLRAEQVTLVDQLLEQLRALDEQMVQVVECRFFAGYTLDETASALNVSARTVQRKWARARMWLLALAAEPEDMASKSAH